MIRMSLKQAKAYGLHGRGLPKTAQDARSQPETAKWPPFTLILPFPPSVNHAYATVGSRRALSKDGKDYHRVVAAIVLGDFYDCKFIHPPEGSRLKVTIRLTMPDHRLRDIANYEKVLIDSLTEAGVWEDDSQIDDLTISREGVENPGKAVVTVERIER